MKKNIEFNAMAKVVFINIACFQHITELCILKISDLKTAILKICGRAQL